jgi:hypothetical protein
MFSTLRRTAVLSPFGVESCPTPQPELWVVVQRFEIMWLMFLILLAIIWLLLQPLQPDRAKSLENPPKQRSLSWFAKFFGGNPSDGAALTPEQRLEGHQRRLEAGAQQSPDAQQRAADQRERKLAERLEEQCSAAAGEHRRTVRALRKKV